MGQWFFHTRKKDFSYFNHLCIALEVQPSLCRREASGSIFQKVKLKGAAGIVEALTSGPCVCGGQTSGEGSFSLPAPLSPLYC